MGADVTRAALAIAIGVLLLVLAPTVAGAQERTPAPALPTPSETACAPGADGSASSIVPDDCWGRFPSSSYDIGFDQGAWNDLTRKVYGTFTDLAFQGARTSTAVALWLVEWAYGFGIYDRLGGSAIDLTVRYQRDIVGPLGLNELAWFYAIAWAAIAALRGRLTMAAGELFTSVIAAIVAAAILANPAGYLHGTFDTMGKLSGAVLATGTGEPPPATGAAATDVMRPLQAQIHSAFVEVPYDYLNWGGPLGPRCAAARDRILASGPHGADDEPRDEMTAAGCDDQAAFNRDPTGSRLFGALLTFGAALVTVVLLALVSITLVVAQALAIVLFAIAPFALLAAVLPGSGRELAWRWLAALARVALVVVGMSLVLSLLLLTVTSLLEATVDVDLVERFALVNVAAVAMLVARKRILTAGHTLAGNLGQRLASRRAGGDRASPWLAAPALAGTTGFALGANLGPDRQSRTSRAASAAGRNYLANQRVARSQRAADGRAQRRAHTTTARHRTELAVDGEGQPTARSVVTVDGPTPTTRRARAARARLEHHTGQVLAAEASRRSKGWARTRHLEPLPPVEFHRDLGDEPTIDVEEA